MAFDLCYFWKETVITFFKTKYLLQALMSLVKNSLWSGIDDKIKEFEGSDEQKKKFFFVDRWSGKSQYNSVQKALQ